MCAHFRIDLGWGGTDVTPGDAGSVHCADALQAPFDDGGDSSKGFRAWVRFGNTCDGFEAAVDDDTQQSKGTAMQLTYCWFHPPEGERTFMILRGRLSQVHACAVCMQLGMPVGTGDFTCAPVPDQLVELFAEHSERVLTQAKAQELFGDNWQQVAW